MVESFWRVEVKVGIVVEVGGVESKFFFGSAYKNRQPLCSHSNICPILQHCVTSPDTHTPPRTHAPFSSTVPNESKSCYLFTGSFVRRRWEAVVTTPKKHH